MHLQKTLLVGIVLQFLVQMQIDTRGVIKTQSNIQDGAVCRNS